MSFRICLVRHRSLSIVYPTAEVFRHEYLKKRWFSIPACAPAAMRCAGQERSDQAEV